MPGFDASIIHLIVEQTQGARPGGAEFARERLRGLAQKGGRRAAQPQAPGFGQFDQPLRIGSRSRQRFFRVDVFARLQATRDDLHVCVMDGEIDHQADAVVSQHGIERWVGLAAVLPGKFLRPAREEITEASQLDLAVFGNLLRIVALAMLPQPTITVLSAFILQSPPPLLKPLIACLDVWHGVAVLGFVFDGNATRVADFLQGRDALFDGHNAVAQRARFMADLLEGHAPAGANVHRRAAAIEGIEDILEMDMYDASRQFPDRLRRVEPLRDRTTPFLSIIGPDSPAGGIADFFQHFRGALLRMVLIAKNQVVPLERFHKFRALLLEEDGRTGAADYAAAERGRDIRDIVPDFRLLPDPISEAGHG